MLTMIRKMLLLSLALLLCFAFVGCAEKEETLTSEQIGQIITEAVDALAEAETYKFDTDMSITMDVIGGTEPGRMSMGADGTGAIDSVNREMQMAMNMTMNVPGQSEQEMGMEVYIVGEWVYVKMSVPLMGEQWMKTKLTPEMWEMQKQVDQQIELLKTATEVSLVGSELVDGTDCYVFDIMPDVEKLAEFLAQQQGMQGMDLKDIEDLAELFEKTSMSIKEWIAKDSSLLMRAQAHMVMEVTPEDVELTLEDFDKMTMDFSTDMTIRDYNQPISVELPPEALQAAEIPVM